MANSPLLPDKQSGLQHDDWHLLAEEAAREQDSDKLLEKVAELTRALDQQEKNQRA